MTKPKAYALKPEDEPRYYGHFINGIVAPATSGETLVTVNPANGRPIGHLAAGDAADVDRAVGAARAAFEGGWRKWKPFERQSLLLRIADRIDSEFEELAKLETTDMGAPLVRTRALRPFIRQMIQFFASQALSIKGETLNTSLSLDVQAMSLREPAGVIAGIIPWNGPLISQWWILGAVLATGCTCVLKPAEDASLSVLRMAEILSDEGLPPGVVNVVTGLGAAAGEALARHPSVDRIAFTGSTATGRKIIHASAEGIKKLQLELGGKSPDIIFADADLEKAVPGAAMGVFSNSGQICYAGTRVLVQKSIHDEFIERLVTFTSGLKIGNGADPTVHLGPLVSAAQRDKVMSYVNIGVEEGAILAIGGERPGGVLADGFFVAPTVFTSVSNDMKIAREEIFGPVVSVIPFEDAEVALGIANDTAFGLGAAVWTQDVKTMYRAVNGLRSGTVWVNCYGALDPVLGFGGVKQSGFGVKGGSDHLDLYLTRKAVYINT